MYLFYVCCLSTNKVAYIINVHVWRGFSRWYMTTNERSSPHRHQSMNVATLPAHLTGRHIHLRRRYQQTDGRTRCKCALAFRWHSTHHTSNQTCRMCRPVVRRQRNDRRDSQRNARLWSSHGCMWRDVTYAKCF